MAANHKTTAADLLDRARLYVLLTQAHSRVPLLDAARATVRGGADLIQLREKDASDRDLLALARRLRDVSAPAGVGFIVNDRPDLARLAEADGVHLGQTDLPVSAARYVLREDQAIGVSTHSLEQAAKAAADGADYIAIGPVYPTATKGYEQGIGLDAAREVVRTVDLPVFAIGGITLGRAPDVGAIGAGRLGVAVCSAVLGADDIEGATAALKAAISGCKS